MKYLLLIGTLALCCSAGAQEKSKPTTAPDLGPSTQEVTPDTRAAPPPSGSYLLTCYGSFNSCSAQYPDDYLYGPGGSDYTWWVYEPDYPIEY